MILLETAASPRNSPRRVAVFLALLALVGFAVLLLVQHFSSIGSGQEHAELQSELASEYSNLLDENGLIHSPLGEETAVLDLYGSALLIESVVENGMPMPEVNAAAISDEVVDEYIAMTGVPAEWAAMALVKLEDASDNVLAAEVPDFSISYSHDADERAVNAWLEAVVVSADQSAHVGQVRDRVQALVGDGDAGLVGAWRLLEACDQLEIDCVWPTSLLLEGDLDDVSDLLEMRAAAELELMGVEVHGWDEEVAARFAEGGLESLEVGDELLASNLGRLSYLTSGDTGSFADYLGRNEYRRDSRTGLYEMYVGRQGTISATYHAMLTLGDYFDDLVADEPTVQSIRSLLLDGYDLDDIERARGLAVLAWLNELDAPLQADLSRLRESLTDKESRAEDAAWALALLEPLRSASYDPSGLSIEPWPVDDETESTISSLIIQAQDGALANSTEILDFYADYVHRLPRTWVEADASDPNTLARLALISNDPTDLTPQQSERIGQAIRSRTGCEDFPNMIRISADPRAPCDVFSTRLAANTGFMARAG